MAIIVEDGSGLTNSNSYASEAELTTYASDRGITVSGTAAQLLIQAMDYIEEQPFKGEKNTEDQALQWPRYNAWVDNFLIAPTEIPTRLKEAQIEAALAIDRGDNPSGTVERTTKREKIDGLEIEYTDGSRYEPYNRALELKLKKLIRSGNGINAMVYRA